MVSPEPDDGGDEQPAQGVSRFRLTEYLFPLLLILLAAWVGWWLVQRSLTRTREQHPSGELRLPANAPPVYEIPRRQSR